MQFPFQIFLFCDSSVAVSGTSLPHPFLQIRHCFLSHIVIPTVSLSESLENRWKSPLLSSSIRIKFPLIRHCLPIQDLKNFRTSTSNISAIRISVSCFGVRCHLPYWAILTSTLLLSPYPNLRPNSFWVMLHEAARIFFFAPNFFSFSKMGLCSNHSPRTYLYCHLRFLLTVFHSSQTSCWCWRQHKNNNIYYYLCFWWIGYSDRIRTIETGVLTSLVFWCFGVSFSGAFLLSDLEYIQSLRYGHWHIQLNLVLRFHQADSHPVFLFLSGCLDCFFMLTFLKSQSDNSLILA